VSRPGGRTQKMSRPKEWGRREWVTKQNILEKKAGAGGGEYFGNNEKESRGGSVTWNGQRTKGGKKHIFFLERNSREDIEDRLVYEHGPSGKISCAGIKKDGSLPEGGARKEEVRTLA